jgi:four helix bundle protein
LRGAGLVRFLLGKMLFMPKSYKELDIYNISFDLFLRVHKFSMKLEIYELGSQVRRSSDSVNSNIVEGYGRRRYKRDFVKFLTYSHSSNDETTNHLRKIQELYPKFEKEIIDLKNSYDLLGGKIHNFIECVIKNWKTE